MVTRNMEKTMDHRLDRLIEIQHEVYDLSCASALAGWDQSIYMPAGGVNDRANVLETLSKLMHQKRTSDELGRLLDDLISYSSRLEPDSFEACLIKRTYDQYIKRTKVPTSHVAEEARLEAAALPAWEKAKKENDFQLFLPHLDERIKLVRQYASFFEPYDHIYDPLLDDHERGMKTAEVQEIFDTARPEIVDLLNAIKSKPLPEYPFLTATYDREKLVEFTKDVVTKLGFDFNRGRVDYSAHPYTTRMGADDVRFTTRLIPNDFRSGLYSSIHEAGHAIYEQGLGKELARTTLADGPSSAMHESQSRFYENMIGKSLPFWRHFYPGFQETFREQVLGISLEDFYRGINTVTPSLIRIEADEVTYSLHIMLRMELEIALLEGKLEAKDLPEVWREKMKQYFGIAPETDSEGVLQDIHWAMGLFGYFPSYALGTMISAQLQERLKEDLPDYDRLIAEGHFDTVQNWLCNKVHRHGAKYSPVEMVEKATGSRIKPEPFIGYLKQKYGWIYQLD